MKYNREQYQPDKYTEILKNNIYVDNLHQTNNHPEELIKFIKLPLIDCERVILTYALVTRTDIQDMKDRLEKKGIKFKYIFSSENPTDMISRGVDINQFVNKLKFWQHGPSWLTKGSSFWPSSNLKCLSSEAKDAVGSELYFTTFDRVNTTPIIDIQRFSTFTKLCNSTAPVFEFIDRCRKQTDSRDHKVDVKLYLIKSMQKVVFGKELKYLKNPHKDEVTKLVELPNWKKFSSSG